MDTGAQANTLPYHLFQRLFPSQTDIQGRPKPGSVTPTAKKLTAYNYSPIMCAGTVSIPTRFQQGPWTEAIFFVVDVPGPAIQGLESCEVLGVLTMHCSIASMDTPAPAYIQNISELQRVYPNQFDRIGKLQTIHKLTVDPNIPPRIDPPRRTSIALKDKIKCELDKMVRDDVICKIEEPTEWVSSLMYVTKKDGSLRVCLDPRALNKALIRPHCSQQTTKEITHKLAGDTVFSKLDAKSGYWSIQLDPCSQLLTTFQTPFCIYCFKRLPFGLKVSQEYVCQRDG